MPEIIETNYTITEYSDTAAALAALKHKFGDVVFEVSTKIGMQDAKTARTTLRGYRTNLESMRKNIKAPAMERCRLIDAEAKDITQQLTALEDPIAQQIKIEEDRQGAEKQAKMNAEIARFSGLREMIAAFAHAVDTIEPKSDACQEAIIRMKAIQIDDTFQELQPDAQQAKDAALFRLQNLFAQYMASEAESKRIMVERAELEQLREADRLRREEEDRKAAEERQMLAAAQEAQLIGERETAERKAREIREAQQAEQCHLDEQAAALKKWQAEIDAAERQRVAETNAADERLRSAAPLLLDALKRLRKAYIKNFYLREQRGIDINDPVLVDANTAINAAQ